MAYENIKCYGWHQEGVQEDELPEVLVLMNRSDIHDIIRLLQLGAEQLDCYGVIRDSVHMIDALYRVLSEHKERCDEDNEDLE